MINKKDFNFVNLSDQEFSTFASRHEQASFMQTLELAELKKELGDIVHLLGVKENNKIIAATLILEEFSFIRYKSFYAPRGFLIDYDNFELLSFFCEKLNDYVKKHKGFRIIADPNVIYQIRDSNGNETSDVKNNKLIENLQKLGYNHFGFNLYNEAMQVRWEYRLLLDKSYDTIKASYAKNTRKNIDSCYKKGLRVRKGNIEDLPTLFSIFESTAKRRDFNFRSLEYYKKMYNHMHSLMTIYIAYIDPKIYYSSAINNLNEEEENNRNIKIKMEKDLIGNKLINQKETSDNLILKYKDEVKKAEQFKSDNPNGKDIGVLLSVKSGNEFLTLSSGILEEYKSFTPKYALYDQHIKDAIDEKYKWVDMYGITGCFDKNDKFYGIYEFKRGFNGNVVELVGQFEKKVSKISIVYDLGKKIKKIIKH